VEYLNNLQTGRSPHRVRSPRRVAILASSAISTSSADVKPGAFNHHDPARPCRCCVTFQLTLLRSFLKIRRTLLAVEDFWLPILQNIARRLRTSCHHSDLVNHLSEITHSSADSASLLAPAWSSVPVPLPDNRIQL